MEPPWVSKLMFKIGCVEKKLDSQYEELLAKFNALEKSFSFVSGEFDNFKVELNQMKEIQDQHSCEIKFLKKELVDQQARSMRNNLIFHGFPEEKDENCEVKILNLIRKNSAVNFNVEIERCHRLGPFKKDKTRPIVAKFLRFKDKEHIKRESHRFKKDKVGTSDQFPKVIQDNRRKLTPIMNEIREAKGVAFLSVDRLYTEGFCYSVEDGVVKKTISKRKVYPASNHRRSKPQSPSLIMEISTPVPVSSLLSEATSVLHN